MKYFLNDSKFFLKSNLVKVAFFGDIKICLGAISVILDFKNVSFRQEMILCRSFEITPNFLWIDPWLDHFFKKVYLIMELKLKRNRWQQYLDVFLKYLIKIALWMSYLKRIMIKQDMPFVKLKPYAALLKIIKARSSFNIALLVEKFSPLV